MENNAHRKKHVFREEVLSGALVESTSIGNLSKGFLEGEVLGKVCTGGGQVGARFLAKFGAKFLAKFSGLFCWDIQSKRKPPQKFQPNIPIAS